MFASKRSLSIVLTAILILAMASSASALSRFACATQCTPTCPCDQACVDEEGFSSTCGDEGYECIAYSAASAEITDEASFLEALSGSEAPTLDNSLQTPAPATAVPTAAAPTAETLTPQASE